MIQPAVDLTGFPILRLDEIERIDSVTLHRANLELTQLVTNCFDKDEDSMMKYMRRQLNYTLNVLAQRRIDKILSGRIEYEQEKDYPNSEPVSTNSIPEESEQKDLNINVSSRTDLSQEYILDLSLDRCSSSLSMLRNNRSSSEVGYIVSGGGKKKRQHMKKSVTETVDETSHRERLARRKAAMDRLMERRQKREAAALKRQEAERRRRSAELLNPSLSSTKPAAPAIDEINDSSSESLSDIDCDDRDGIDDSRIVFMDAQLENVFHGQQDTIRTSSSDIQFINLETGVCEIIADSLSRNSGSVSEGYETDHLLSHTAEYNPEVVDNPTNSLCEVIHSASRCESYEPSELPIVEVQDFRPITHDLNQDSVRSVEMRFELSQSMVNYAIQSHEALICSTSKLFTSSVPIDKVLFDKSTAAALATIRQLQQAKRLKIPMLSSSDKFPLKSAFTSQDSEDSSRLDAKETSTYDWEYCNSKDLTLYSKIVPTAVDPIDMVLSQWSDNDGGKSRSLMSSYENIGMIFPHAINNTTNGAINIRNLVECMHNQLRLMESWCEVMEDYSTVFCAEKGDLINNSSNNKSSLVYSGEDAAKALHYKVKSTRSDVTNIVSSVFSQLSDWVELPSGLGIASWNCLWTWGRPKLNMEQLLIWQRYNHFLDSKQLTRKDLLKRNLQRYTDSKSKISGSFEIMPITFSLPHEYNQFIDSFIKYESIDCTNNIWILKPIGLSRGRGISLIRDLADLSYSQTCVLQKYIEKPLCLHGYKFDLRLYVLVTSFKPLEAFIYKEGFARVSTQKYSLSKENTSNRFIHLTNSSIQKRSLFGPSEDNPVLSSGEDGGGTKISLRGEDGLWKQLSRAGIDIHELWKHICLLVIKSLIVVNDLMIQQPCAFEVYGYDVLVDEDLRPWLLEVNASPSLARENNLDSRVKNAMIRDTINLLDVAPFDRAVLGKILRRRLDDLAKSKFSMSRNDSKLEADLSAILGSYRPRQIGNMPSIVGDYQRLCPNTNLWDDVLKLKNKIIRS